MQFDNKQCFECIGKHICGPKVTPAMKMCSDFLLTIKEKLTASNNELSRCKYYKECNERKERSCRGERKVCFLS